VIRLDGDLYWLYAAVGPGTNEVHQRVIEPTKITVTVRSFFRELREKHDVEDVMFLVAGATSLTNACNRLEHRFRSETHGKRNSVERIFRDIQRGASSFANCFSNGEAETTDNWLRLFAFA
jgi:putative transposase